MVEKVIVLDGRYEWAGKSVGGGFVHRPVQFLMSGIIEAIWESLEGHVEVVISNPPLQGLLAFISPTEYPQSMDIDDPSTALVSTTIFILSIVYYRLYK